MTRSASWCEIYERRGRCPEQDVRCGEQRHRRKRSCDPEAEKVALSVARRVTVEPIALTGRLRTPNVNREARPHRRVHKRARVLPGERRETRADSHLPEHHWLRRMPGRDRRPRLRRRGHLPKRNRGSVTDVTSRAICRETARLS